GRECTVGKLRAQGKSDLRQRVARTDAPAEWVLFVQQQSRFPIDKGRAGDGGNDLVAGASKTAGEGASQDAFLDPGLAFPQASLRRQASEFRAGPRAARGAIISFARAENKVARMRSRGFRGAEQFDVI